MKIQKLSKYDLKELGYRYTAHPMAACTLPANALKVYMALCDLQELEPDEEGRLKPSGLCHATDREVAAYLDMHVSSITRVYSVLEELGILIRGFYPEDRSIKVINHIPFEQMQLEADERLRAIRSEHRVTTASQRKFHNITEPKTVYIESGTVRETAYSKPPDIRKPAYSELSAQGKSEADSELTKGRVYAVSREEETQFCVDFGSRVHHYNKLNKHNSDQVGEVEEAEEEEVGILSTETLTPSPEVVSTPAEPVIDSPLQRDLPEYLPTIPDFGTKRTPLTQADLDKLKGLDRLLQDPKNARPSDILAYYDHKYQEKYGHSGVSKKQYKDRGMLGIIKTTFMSRYKPEEWVPILDNYLSLYDQVSGDHAKYPRPSILGLSQTWLIEQTEAHAAKESKYMADKAMEVQEKKREEAEKELPRLQAQFILRLDGISEEFTETVFYPKYQAGRFNDSPYWFNSLTLDLDTIRREVESA